MNFTEQEQGVIKTARKAVDYLHGDQRRNNHALHRRHAEAVMGIVRERGGGVAEAIAAYAHSVPKDCHAMLARLAENEPSPVPYTGTALTHFEQSARDALYFHLGGELCGARVLEILDGLADEPGWDTLPPAVRKAKQAEKLCMRDANTQLVKLACCTDSLENCARSNPQLFGGTQACHEYAAGVMHVVRECTRAAALAPDLRMRCEHAFAQIVANAP